MNKWKEDNVSKELVLYSDYELGSLVKKYAGEAGMMAWIDEANKSLARIMSRRISMDMGV